MESQSNTRSGKTYNNNLDRLVKLKPIQCECEFCLKEGHCIKKCNSPMIEHIHQELIDAAIFSYFVTDNTDFLRIWLRTFPVEYLCVIGYKFGIKKTKFESYMILLETIYWNTQIQIPLGIELFERIDEKRIQYFARKLVERLPTFDYRIGEILYTLRPPQRKFNIRTMMLCRETSEELKELKECPICLSDEIKYADILTTNCKHIYCKPCLANYFKSLNRKPLTTIPKCPMCRTDIKTLEIKDPEIYKEINKKFCISPKTPFQEIIETIQNIVGF